MESRSARLGIDNDRGERGYKVNVAPGEDAPLIRTTVAIDSLTTRD
jgi:hypothetical protein